MIVIKIKTTVEYFIILVRPTTKAHEEGYFENFHVSF